jgi:flagellar basal-body rod modification protein FlgD
MTSALTGVSTSPSTASSQTGTSALGQDTFLKLLTTQLQNQDPSNPVSNEEFVAQLATFSQLEELQGISGGLDSLYMVNTSMNNAAMTSLMGQTVVARSDTFHYDGEGSQSVHYDADGSATAATLTISDSDGHVVWSGDMGALESGEGEYAWDGKDMNGNALPEGDYTFSVSATDSNGESVDVQGLIVGEIDQMSFEDGSASPTVDGVDIALSDIVRLTSADE